jgi:signal transduction histidine kinase
MASASPTRPAPPLWQVPQIVRGRSPGLGVASAIAAELGLDPLAVRAAFVVLVAANGAGVLLYLAAFAFLTIYAARHPARVYVPVPKARSERERLAGLVLVTGGVLVIVRSATPTFPDALVWPVALIGAGVLVAVAHARRDGITRSSDLLTADTSRLALARILAGLGLAAAGATALITLNLDLTSIGTTLVSAVVILAGVGLVVAPWAYRVVSELAAERQERVRAQERAALATHLHDSVLQTLALIQRNAGDAAATARLARRQERELRSWLYGGEAAAPGTSVRAALEAQAADLEDAHGIAVELVVVGDAPVDAAAESLLAAVREAIVNAAKHAGVERVDVYAEIDGDAVEAFVRDQGRGFDPAAVPADRRGLRDSIRGRVERAGGTVEVRSASGEGTEVELRVPRRPT